MTDLAAPKQPTVVSPNVAALEAIAHTREAALFTRQATDRLLEIAQLQQTPPELRTIVINPGNSGQYVTTDACRFQAKSIGVINPTTVGVFLGIAGVSATAAARSIAVAPQSMLTLPIAVEDLELGCDPAVLLAGTAVVFLLRFLAVQPLNVQLLR